MNLEDIPSTQDFDRKSFLKNVLNLLKISRDGDLLDFCSLGIKPYEEYLLQEGLWWLQGSNHIQNLILNWNVNAR